MVEHLFPVGRQSCGQVLLWDTRVTLDSLLCDTCITLDSLQCDACVTSDCLLCDAWGSDLETGNATKEPMAVSAGRPPDESKLAIAIAQVSKP
eukprot:1196205-Prorocentrum_minimum.AAC.2